MGDLDILTFRTLVASVIRVHYSLKTEDAWTRMIAAQGEHKVMQKWLDGWRRFTGAKPKKKNADDLIRDFGRNL